MGFNVHTINEKVAQSYFGRWFRLEGSGHPLSRPGSKFLTEIRAGCVTAAAMLYIIVSCDYRIAVLYFYWHRRLLSCALFFSLSMPVS